jgi:hypothetical protein
MYKIQWIISGGAIKEALKVKTESQPSWNILGFKSLILYKCSLNRNKDMKLCNKWHFVGKTNHR